MYSNNTTVLSYSVLRISSCFAGDIICWTLLLQYDIFFSYMIPIIPDNFKHLAVQYWQTANDTAYTHKSTSVLLAFFILTLFITKKLVMCPVYLDYS
jgi:hypothetical protein